MTEPEYDYLGQYVEGLLKSDTQSIYSQNFSQTSFAGESTTDGGDLENCELDEEQEDEYTELPKHACR